MSGMIGSQWVGTPLVKDNRRLLPRPNFFSQIVTTMVAVVAAIPGAFADDSTTAKWDDWKTATPEEVGMDSAPLAEMFDFVRADEIPVHSVHRENASIFEHCALCVEAPARPVEGRRPLIVRWPKRGGRGVHGELPREVGSVSRRITIL